MRRDQTFKMKEIGELVANLLVWVNKLAFLKENKHTKLSTFRMNAREV